MRSFFRNSSGAVTVFVSFLLVPALLVSGTAVDLARIHTARSIVQDANQLAANSVLTQYNALLHDIYGVMGVEADDPILFALLDEYVRVSIFGEAHDKSFGTLQLFYGSDLSMEEIAFQRDQNLGDAGVLRRQIEEYMKFRGPVIIVEQFLAALDNNNLKEDTEIIKDKMDIDSSIADIYDKYKELYDAINAADLLMSITYGISGASFGAVSSRLKLIQGQFVTLRNTYSSWENAPYTATDTSLKDDRAAHYYAMLDNFRVYTVGGGLGVNWSDGGWRRPLNPINVGLIESIEKAKLQGENFKQKFDLVVDIAKEIDSMNGELRKKIDDLEEKINKSENEEFKSSLTEKTGVPPMSVIERYRSILGWDAIEVMAKAFSDGGYDYIDNSFIPLLDGVCYRNLGNSSAPTLSLDELISLSSDSRFDLSESVSAARSMAGIFAAFPESSVTYGMPPGFKKFAEHPGKNREFYEALKAMITQPPLAPVKIFDGQEEEESESGSDSEGKQRNIIKNLLEIVESAYIGLSNQPLGARHISDSSTAARERLGITDIVRLIPSALSNPVMQAIHDPIGSIERAGDYLLLLTYSTSMFSNYTTTRPESIGKSKDKLDEIEFPKSITGVPISPEVNYFFQSEWEYLYSGYDNAGKNLNAITSLLFIVRLVCNYITVFSVQEVTAVVSSIRVAFAWNPPLGIVLGELARAAFVAAESLIDVAALRTGHKVPFLKNAKEGEWVCCPSGIKNVISKLVSGESEDGEEKKEEKEEKEEKGLTYSNYMLIFFAAKALFHVRSDPDPATELATRTGNLIEWNMVNYISKAGADETKMAEALVARNRFRLVYMKTGFSLTTTVNMRMLFLSLPFAQHYTDSRGIYMPGTIPIRVTDHRGY